MEQLTSIKGLHHVTATVDDAQEDYNFYVKLLGQRLIKETVNFDNERVYHFYYGNEVGSPSTIFTTFPYKGEGVPRGTIGAGQVVETAYAARPGSLSFWRDRLTSHGIEVTMITRFGRTMLRFRDPSGLNLLIVEDPSDTREPVWQAPGIPASNLLPGIHHVTMAVRYPSDTIAFLEAFGYKVLLTDGDFTHLEAGEGGAGNTLVVQDARDMPNGVNGLGTVHHVAHRVASLEDSLHIKEVMESVHGLRVTGVKDRNYFKSIYFRIPGGVLFEVATEGPGFMVDESREELGTSLRLPEWQEPHRQRIEAHLPKYFR